MKKDDSEVFSWRSRAALLLGRGLLQLLGRTWRFRVVNAEAVGKLRAAKTAFIYSLWHGHLLPLLWFHRDQGVGVLISEHRDGELVARAATSLGFGLIRGSTTRGADRALISIVRELQAGREVAITPDGPRGPLHKFAPGALVAAQRSDSYIVPVAAVADRAWHLNSWDSFMIPKPFARVTIAYGPATKVIASTPRAAAEEGERFEELMGETIRIAGG
ncbi:MAG TPA: lysophospholipid acyltransferase family protein [Gemmatimonadaceae bacterium]|nr:lysophospholipid acyltransferase family protein [Gemmatimonadaceae bacterium]